MTTTLSPPTITLSAPPDPASSRVAGVIGSPVGALTLEVAGDVLTELSFARAGTNPAPVPPPLRDVAEQLAAYFAGDREHFDLSIHLAGSPFQVAVWTALLTIPYGAVASYGEIARRVGRPTAARAVGAANGRNPIAIIVPCHRVIGSNHRLVGYGGGLDRKAWLLDHERCQAR